jgi:heme-degrading monooxygenase HmoA
MYAILAATSIAPDKQAAYLVYVAETAASRARQPGFLGALSVGTGAGGHLHLSIWETQAAQQAFQTVLAASQEPMGLPPTASCTVLGAGAILFNTLTAGATPGYVIFSELTYAPGQWVAGQAQTEEYFALRAQQPGYRGTLGFDVGTERRLMVIGWESEAQFAASRAVLVLLVPAAARLVAPLFVAPPRHIGDGTVAYDSLTTRP